MKVHSALGPGLLESTYETCLCHELAKAGLGFMRQVPVSLSYDSLEIEGAFRMDLVVDHKAVVEIKAVEQLNAIHDAQLLTYLKMSGLPLGLLINFNVTRLRNGIHRRVLTRR